MDNTNQTARDRYAAACTREKAIGDEIKTALQAQFPDQADLVPPLTRIIGQIADVVSKHGCGPGTVGWGLLTGLMAAEATNPGPRALLSGTADEVKANQLRGYEMGVQIDAIVSKYDAEFEKIETETQNALKEDVALAEEVGFQSLPGLAVLFGNAPIDGFAAEEITEAVSSVQVGDMLAAPLDEPAEAFAPDTDGATEDDEDELL